MGDMVYLLDVVHPDVIFGCQLCTEVHDTQEYLAKITAEAVEGLDSVADGWYCGCSPVNISQFQLFIRHQSGSPMNLVGRSSCFGVVTAGEMTSVKSASVKSLDVPR